MSHAINVDKTCTNCKHEENLKSEYPCVIATDVYGVCNRWEEKIDEEEQDMLEFI